MLSLSLFLAWFYRPFIYSQGYFDLYIADVFPSLLAVPLMTSLALLKKKELMVKEVFIMFAAVIVIEVLQLFTGGFDYKDIVAAIIGTVLALYFWRGNITFIFSKLQK